MRAPRGLSPDEAALWHKLASTVRPMHPAPKRPAAPVNAAAPPPAPPAKQPKKLAARAHPVPLHQPAASPPLRPVDGGHGLDSHWERRLSRTSTQPDFTLDLHGCNLEQAHRRLDDGLVQAKAMGARLVLVVTGKPRPVDAADRGERRGAIRAKVLDWLAAGPHGSDIAAVRPAQRRHGGEGAIYLVLRRAR
ncbi:MAG: Smr/MutS family protein [Erythrobacter sp.]|nr:Smr/MutS family protein [Erythrobacter sp.]